MLNASVGELNDKILEWGAKRDDLIEMAKRFQADAQAFSGKIASAKTAIDLIEGLMKDEPVQPIAHASAPSESAPTAPAQPTKTYVNPDIQVSRWGKGELEDTIMLVLRREDDFMTTTEIMNAVMQNRGRKVIETSLYNCLERIVLAKKIVKSTKNGRIVYRLAALRAASNRPA